MSQEVSILITVNGQVQQVPVGSTVLDLLKQLEVLQPAIAVERNSVICSQEQFGSTPIEDGDVFEIVSLVGGG